MVARLCAARCALGLVMKHAGTDVSWDPALGVYINHRLGACNVWDMDVGTDAIARAHDIFRSSIQAPLAELTSTDAGRRRHALRTSAGDFFVMRPPDWNSDICWVSCDDEATFATFEDIFHGMGIPQAFAPVVGHSEQIRMYSAFYVVRSKCSALKMHCDYLTEVRV